MQRCPIGSTGHARWECAEVNGEAVWATEQPDMSNCKSGAMSKLEEQVRNEDPDNVIVSSLAYQTRTKSLYGGDLETVVATMRTIASRIQYRLQNGVFHNKESHIAQVLQHVFSSAKNILDEDKKEAWMDLSKESQMKVANQLMLALEESAFLLAGVQNKAKVEMESSPVLSK